MTIQRYNVFHEHFGQSYDWPSDAGPYVRWGDHKALTETLEQKIESLRLTIIHIHAISSASARAGKT